MKTNYSTKLIKTLLALTLFTLVVGNAAAQADLTSENQTPQVTVPGEGTSDGGESF